MVSGVPVTSTEWAATRCFGNIDRYAEVVLHDAIRQRVDSLSSLSAARSPELSVEALIMGIFRWNDVTILRFRLDVRLMYESV